VYVRTDAFGNPDSIRSRRFNAAEGQFEDDEVAVSQPSAAVRAFTELRVQFDAAGTTAVAVWAEKVLVFALGQTKSVHAAVYREGAWSPAQQLSVPLPGDPTAQLPDVAFDDAGNAMVVWTHPTLQTVSRRLPAGGEQWQPSLLVSGLVDVGGNTWSHQRLRLAPLPGGDFALVAAETGPRPPPASGSGSYVAVYRYFAAEATWTYGNRQGATLLYYMPDAPQSGNVAEFDLSANDAGRLVLAWAHDYGVSTQVPPLPSRRAIHLARFDPASGAWTTVQEPADVISTGTTPSDGPGWRSAFPAAVVGPAGDALLVWAQETLVDGSFFGVRSRALGAASATFDGAPEVVDASTGAMTGVLLARGTGTRCLAVWSLQAATGPAVRYAASAAQGATFAAPGAVTATSASEKQSIEALAFAPDGTAIALSRRNLDIYVNRFK
jgi:hypothetical protein